MIGDEDMTPEIGFLLLKLEAELGAALNAIEAETMAKFRTLARSTGQRTRADRLLTGDISSQR